MELTKGKQYTVNGNSGMVYKFSTTISRGRAQHWFFHVDGYMNCSLTDLELDTFLTA